MPCVIGSLGRSVVALPILAWHICKSSPYPGLLHSWQNRFAIKIYIMPYLVNTLPQIFQK